MIRPATLADLPDVYFLARKFAQEYSAIPLDYDKTWTMLGGLLENGTCFIAFKNGKPSGAICGMAMEHPYLDCATLVELGWYSDPAHAYPLLKAFIAAGKELGIDLITASTLNNSPRAARVLMERAGMLKAEDVWHMKL